MARGAKLHRKIPAKTVVINANDHVFGRLAATVAKHLLRGERVVVLRCEGLVLSGPFLRNKLKYVRWFHKRHVTNPKRGPFHFRAPSHLFIRAVRGMIPYLTKRGAWAMRRLAAFDGVPPPYDKTKAFVVPRALRRLRLDPLRDYCRMGRICHELGWQHQETVKTLEAKRKRAGEVFLKEKVAKLTLAKQAAAAVDKTLSKKIGAPKANLLAKFTVKTA